MVCNDIPGYDDGCGHVYNKLSVSYDGYRGGPRYLHAESNDHNKGLLASRIGVLIAIIVTVILSYVLPQVWDGAIAIATGLFFGLCGAAFLPMFVGALYAKNMTKAAAISGLIAGFSASILWMVFFHTKEASVFGLVNAIFGTPDAPVNSLSSSMIIQNLDPLFIALPVSIIVTVAVQLATRKKQPLSQRAR